MPPIRIAILGQGRSGWRIHAQNLMNDREHFQIVAVVDPLPERRAYAVAALGCEAFAGYEALLGRTDLDLIVNCTPSYRHAEITEILLRAGFNVLCEKPLARRAAEVDRLIAAARESGKVFAIFQQSRYAPYFQQVQNIIASGRLGRIVQISIAFNNYARRWDWQCVQRFNGGNLLNTGPHPLDQALQLFGGEDMPEVRCFMDRANTAGDAEDYVKLLLSGRGHPVIDLEISSCCAYPCFTYQIQGTRGGLKGTTEEIDWKYYLPDENPPRPLILEPLSDADGQPAYCSEQLVWHQEKWRADDQTKIVVNSFGNMTLDFYRMLYRTLTEGAPLEITPEQVRRQIAVIEECHRQNPLSQWV